MKKTQVHIGRTYVTKVSGQLAQVRIDRENPHGGWDAINVSTRRMVRIKSAQRLRREVRDATEGGPPPSERAVVHVDPPRKDVDERHAAAPPSIVPYEQRRARAEAAQSEMPDDGGPAYDRSRCATPRCKGTPAMTYVGRPLCQECWDRQCDEESPSEVSENACLPVGTTGDARRPADESETPEKENVMSNKKSTKKQSAKKQTKARPVPTKAKGKKAKAADAVGTKASRPKKTAGKAEPKASKPKKAAGDKKPKRVSALDAAAQVLAKAGKPMRAQELIAAMADAGLWKSPAGKTPHATLYAAMMREARDKGRDSRFKKVDRGMFAFQKAGA
jgi:hypothetical protein